MTKETVRDWLSSLAQGLGVEEIRQYEEHEWVLAWDESNFIELTYDEATDKLFFEAEVGPLPEGREWEMTRVLLQINTQWRDSGGLRLGLSAANEQVVLIDDTNFINLEAESLGAMILSFLEKAEEARQLLQSEGEVDSPAFGMPAGFLRV